MITAKAPTVGADRTSRLKFLMVALDGLPLLGRWPLVGGAAVGMIGAVAGLVVGLTVYAPTAPFAAIELGVPAAITGAVIGLIVGLIVMAGRRTRQRLIRGSQG